MEEKTTREIEKDNIKLIRKNRKLEKEINKIIIYRIIIVILLIGIIFESIALATQCGVINDLKQSPEYWYSKFVDCQLNK